MTTNFGGFSFTVSLGQWLAAGGSIIPSLTPNVATTLAQSLADHIGTLAHLLDSLTLFDGATVTNAHARLRYSFLPFLFDTTVQIDVDNIAFHYEVGTVTAETKLVQPPSITVDPPAFAFQADGTNDLSGVQGRLTIRGGDAPEIGGDRVIVHNQDGTVSSIGGLQTFTQPRYVQVGQDAAGHAIYAQDHDSSSGIALYTSSLELTGMGLGITNAAHLGLDHVSVFHGIELQGIENIDIRMGDGNDTFTVGDTGFVANTNGSASTTLLPTALTIAAGGGNDTIYLQAIGGQTRILGGGGADTVEVHSPASRSRRSSAASASTATAPSPSRRSPSSTTTRASRSS